MRTFEQILEQTRKDFRVFTLEELIQQMASLRWVAEGAGRVDLKEDHPVRMGGEVVAA